ncbi:hypothetical protein [Amycolatopsis sp. FDAARGOS 1241]|uniref:hypothetical protein n=1 Tax=Amycolatopsis sp. FDAARGOS 1241 TaxID=2778070 RepID=UPI00194E7087|nr:hypothetical protein [Amycolatopsis sp. FDAARGOS 1241]QRP47225.1 hypothetical protein I6J71_04240 [Amycolatopsis sp. FDAARGOS 1241]
MSEFVRRGGLLVPADVETIVARPTPKPGCAEVDECAPERPADGYTGRVRELEAAAAEAERVRALPSEAVLERHQELAEADMLAELDTKARARELERKGERDTAELVAAAKSAAGQRERETDVNVRALQLGRRRRRWTLIGWAVLVLSMAYTCVNVQHFAAGTAPAWSPQWLVAWGVDPLLSALVIGLLLARGDLAAFGAAMSATAGRAKHVILGVEIGALGAALLMNVAPEFDAPRVRWQDVALHIVVPLAGVAAAVVLPIVQGFYAEAITGLYTDPSARPQSTINLRKHAEDGPAEAELPEDVRTLLDATKQAVAAGELGTDPTGYAIYRHVMNGRGDRGRAYRVAPLVQGFRPRQVKGAA